MVFNVVDPAGILTVAAPLSNHQDNTVGGLLKSGNGTMLLSGNNTYTSTTTVSAGTLQVGKTQSLYTGNQTNWTAANINVKSGATLALNVDSAGTAGFTSTNLDTLLGNISVAGNATSGLQSGATIPFDTGTATNGTFTQGNAIANSTGANGGAIGLTKLGSGVLVLDKSNTYTGTTTVNLGTLEVTGNLTATTQVAVNGGSLMVGASNVINDDATVALGGGTILRGSGVSETFGALTLSANSTLDFGTGTAGTMGFGTYSPNYLLTISNFGAGNSKYSVTPVRVQPARMERKFFWRG